MRTRKSIGRTITLATITGFALVVAACGGDDDDSSVRDAIREQVEEGNLPSVPENVGGDAGDLPDPCVMVTTEDAAELFGEEAQVEEDASPVKIGASCIYGNVAGEELGNVAHLLQVRVYDGEQFFGPETYDDEESIAGLGDDAFVRTSDGAGGIVEVQFVQGGKTVSLSYSAVNIGVDDSDKVDPTEREAEVIDLAEQAAGRM
jgi:hypothetical protein